MDVFLKRRDGFIYFEASSSEEITREDAQNIQEKYGSLIQSNGFYAFVRKKKQQQFEVSWACRDENNKLCDVPIIQ